MSDFIELYNITQTSENAVGTAFESLGGRFIYWTSVSESMEYGPRATQNRVDYDSGVPDLFCNIIYQKGPKQPQTVIFMDFLRKSLNIT